MIRLNKKIRILLIVLIMLVLGGGGAAIYFFVIKKDDSSTSTSPVTKVEQDKKVDDVLTYLKSESSLSTFNTLISKIDFAKLQAPNQAGVKPKVILLAPDETAFSKDESKAILKLSDQLKDEVSRFHVVTITPTETNKEAELSLKDGDKLTTINNKTITVKQAANQTTFIDGKGRTAKAIFPKVIGNDGTVLIKIDNILLFQ